MGIAFRFAAEMVSALVVGGGVGWGLDWLFGRFGFHTRPVFMLVMFILGAAFVYYLMLPMAVKFFVGFQTTGTPDTMAIQLQAKVSEYLSLIMTLILAFGLAFQLPVLLTLMARVSIITSAQLAEKRRYAIVGIFIAAAILTPPDVFSQVSLAIPLLVLYELSIFSCRWVEKQKAAREAAEEAELSGKPGE